jgi:uncharacterized protein YecE (DUF72 family)
MTGNAHIGTMGWSYSYWTGTFYPKGTPAGKLLTEYLKHFDTVEVDNTFYRIPYASTVTKWKELTPSNFLFAAKFPKIITHDKMLVDSGEELWVYLKSISQLGSKLGPMLIQFPSEFGPQHMRSLREFLPTLPRGKRFVVEIRNRALLGDDLYNLLRENGVALAFVDSPSMPLSEEITADFAYVRWEGDRRKVNGKMGRTEIDRGKEIERWSVKIRKMLDIVPHVFGYFSKYYSGYPPDDAKRLVGLL